MATLPGLPQTDEPEPDALPVEPDDASKLPVDPDSPGHKPVDPPRLTRGSSACRRRLSKV